MKSSGRGLMMAAALILGTPLPGRGNGFKTMAKELGRAAMRAGIKRLTVLPFLPGDASPAKEGWNISEKLLTQIVRRGDIQAVERSMLRRLMEEHHLARTGIVDPSMLKKIGKIFSVEAVIAGSFVNAGEETILDARLINVETGVIIAAAERRVEREEFGLLGTDPAVDDRTASLWVPVPEMTVAAPELPSEPLPAAEAGDEERSCANASQRVDDLEAQILDVKARYWAGQLRKGVSLRGLTVNPGSTITDPALKKSFYDRMQYWYELENIPELTPSEIRKFVSVDRQAFSLYSECGV